MNATITLPNSYQAYCNLSAKLIAGPKLWSGYVSPTN
jgi:hypothetical protein